MLKFFGRYAGQMAFSLIGTVLGALIVTNLGLYSPFARAPQPVSEAESELAIQRIRETHQAIREQLDANQAEANRIAAAERQAKAEAAAAAIRAEEAARARAAAQERARKLAAAKREAVPLPHPAPQVAAGASPPVNIVPVVNAPEPPRGNPFEEFTGKVKSAAVKVRDMVVDAVRLDRIFRNPFGDGFESARSNAGGQRFGGLDL